jgi:hypothetical protein
MFRSNDEMALRDSLCEEIKLAFERAGVGVVYQRYDSMPYSSIIAYLSYGFGGQRQALVTVSDKGDCNAYISKIYSVPEGKTGRNVDPGQMPLLFTLSHPTPDLGESIVGRVREASIDDSETMPTKLFEAPRPPIPVRDLKTLGDLIDAYEAHYLCEPYSDLLGKVLGRMGKVSHKGEEWFVDIGAHICHIETAPGSTPILDPDGEPIVHTNAANVKLAPFLDDEQEPEP